MEETKNNVDEIRKYALKALDAIKNYTGYDSNQPGFHVSLRRGMEKWLSPEGVWELRIAGLGKPPLDDLRDLFSPCSKEDKVDTVTTVRHDFDLERSPNAKVEYSMEIWRDLTPEDTGWLFACSTREIPPDVIHMGYAEFSDTRDVGYKGIKTYLHLSDADDPLVVLTKFWDFVSDKLRSHEYDEEFISGFLHIIDRLKGMLLTGKTPAFVFTSRTTLETNGVDEEKQNWNLVLTRTLEEGVDAWVVRITPVEGGFNLVNPEVFAELSAKRRPGSFQVENIIRSDATFTGRSSFCRALDLSVKTIVQALGEESRPLEIETLRKVQEKLKAAFTKGIQFEDMEGKQKD